MREGYSWLLFYSFLLPILLFYSSVPAHTTHFLWVRPRRSRDSGGKGTLTYVEGVLWIKWIFIATSLQELLWFL